MVYREELVDAAHCRDLRVNRYLAKHHEETLVALEQVVAGTGADKERRPAPSKPQADPPRGLL
jgi:hypothetical protein